MEGGVFCVFFIVEGKSLCRVFYICLWMFFYSGFMLFDFLFVGYENCVKYGKDGFFCFNYKVCFYVVKEFVKRKFMGVCCIDFY